MAEIWTDAIIGGQRQRVRHADWSTWREDMAWAILSPPWLEVSAPALPELPYLPLAATDGGPTPLDVAGIYSLLGEWIQERSAQRRASRPDLSRARLDWEDATLRLRLECWRKDAERWARVVASHG